MYPDVPGATVCNADEPLLNNTLFAAGEDNPVPPLAAFNVPPNVTSPDAGVDGVSPVVPPLKEVMPTW